jgi:Flp pilus assembly protein TadG
MMTTLLALGSLGLDIAHVQVINIEVQRAADAGALAGAHQLQNGTAAAINAAMATATENTVDDQPINSAAVTVQLLNWTSSSNYTVVTTASAANAVRVTISNDTPLLFAKVIGFSDHVATRATTAKQVIQSVTSYVSAHSNPWLAGEPLGTQGSDPDSGWKGQGVVHEHPWEYDIAGTPGDVNTEGEPYESPVQIGITVTPGAIITLSNVSGQGNNDFTQSSQYDATGNSNGYVANYDDEASNGIAEHGIADSTMPLNAVNAVFLGKSLPDSQTAPSTLDFSTQSARDYAANTNNGEVLTSGQFSPKPQQVFYVGDGMTSTGQRETVVVPQGATRLFLGTMDGHEWSNNEGGFNVTVSQTNVLIVQ